MPKWRGEDFQSQADVEKAQREARAADRRNREAQHRRAGEARKQEKAGSFWRGKH